MLRLLGQGWDGREGENSGARRWSAFAGLTPGIFAAAVIAALRGERELAIGNVGGSCVCNIGLVMGVTAMVPRVGVPVDLAADGSICR